MTSDKQHQGELDRGDFYADHAGQPCARLAWDESTGFHACERPARYGWSWIWPRHEDQVLASYPMCADCVADLRANDSKARDGEYRCWTLPEAPITLTACSPTANCPTPSARGSQR